MSELEESEEPSTRRLQSRAAKSAIRRAQQIYDAESARTELDTISDLNERNERAAMLRLQADKELKYLSNRLSELIPTDLALDQRRTSSVQQYQQYNPNSFSRTSENEYMISTRTDRSPALERLLNGHDNSKDGDSKRYEIDYLNPMGDNSDETDNEFVEKWSKRYKKTTDDAATDDEEEDSSDGLGRKILA